LLYMQRLFVSRSRQIFLEERVWGIVLRCFFFEVSRERRLNVFPTRSLVLKDDTAMWLILADLENWCRNICALSL
jgi:hypothetical protein